MKKINKIDYIYIGLLIVFITGFVLYLRYKGFLFGSNMDWISQHVSIPEYFRLLFYETKEFIPQFGINLGLGQNIFNFTYYGLFSPYIVISYLLPFIKMIDYIQIITILSIIASVILMYRWIYNKYDSKVAVASTIIFMLAGPLLFHAHRHIMFVNYLPFLIGALILIDIYFIKKKRILFILSIFLLIMSSFYFSFPSILVIGIYTIYKILQDKKKLNIKSFKPLGKIIFYVIIGILLSGIIIIPTMYALYNGRSDTSVSINLFNLFMPKLNYKLTFYYSYSLGLTFIYMVSLIYSFINKKRENIFLSIILFLCMLMPGISYILNCFMYIDGKCFIPFLPLAIIIISYFLNDLFKNKINLKKLIYHLIPIIVIMLCSATNYNLASLLIIDIILIMLFLIIINKTKKSKLIFIPIILISFTSFLKLNLTDNYVTIKDSKLINDYSYQELLNYINKDEMYRTSIDSSLLNQVNKVYKTNQYSSSIYSSSSNQNYLKFVRDNFLNEIINKDYATITQSSNVLFNIYNGSKYLITNKEPLIGYKEVARENNLVLYENNDVLPIGYASSNIMSLREFDTLTYPNNIDALLNYIIVNKSLDNVYKSNINPFNHNITITNHNNLNYEIKDNNHLYINSLDEGYFNLNLNKEINNKILIIQFKMNKEKSGNVCSTNITINNTTNSLSCSNWKYHNNNYTFEYVISKDKPFNNLDVYFTQGEYELSDLKLYTIDYNYIKNLNHNISAFNIDKNKSTSNSIYGTINVKEDGYLKLTIPYEKKGFKAYVDGERVPRIKVDDTFIGFEIEKGNHTIEIIYNAPFYKHGIIVSIIGLILLICVIFYNKLERKIKIIYEKALTILKNISKRISIFLINNRGYTYLFFSMLILDLALRIFYYSSINFYGWYRLVPNLFTILWVSFILLLTYNFKAKLGKIIYFVSYILSLILFLVHAIYYSYFNIYFDWSVITLAGEGTAYLNSILLNIKLWVIITTIISIYLTIKGIKLINHNHKFEPFRIISILLIFITCYSVIPFLLGNVRDSIEWDDWRNPRSIYKSFNDNNKSMMISGMYQYNIRNFYVNFIRNSEKLNQEETNLLKENFKEKKVGNINNYTGIFKDKNIILVQLESIDDFLVNSKIMPTTYKMMKNSINFTNHYSFTSGGGSTFNSEFMVNTGYSSAYHYNQSAYSFSRNNYDYSLPNLLRKSGYKSNAFHMNTGEYYSRGVNYKSFGFDSYYGLKDISKYNENTDYWLDRELILNSEFNKLIFNNEGLSMSFIITYSAHMPYKTTRGTCSMLTEEPGLTEYECLKLQAKETDYFMSLLLENLEKNNMLDNTVIVAFTDHYLYTLEDKSLLDEYKVTDNNLINKTPFFIWSNGNYKKTVRKTNSQLDILPTIFNLFGVEYYSNYYIGNDILDPNYQELIFFPDGSWYNGKSYIANGEYQFGKKMSIDKLNENNINVKRKMTLNDAVMKSNYFNNLSKKAVN